MVEATKKSTDGAGPQVPAPTRRRGGIVSFYSETVREMKKVTWPTWKETYLTTIMVFIMVALTVVFFFFVDTVLAYGERLLIGAVG